VHQRALAWIALVPLLVVLRTRTRMPDAVIAAGVWGMLAAYATTDWLPPALEVYYRQPWWLGFSLFATAAFLMGAVEYMAFAVCYWTLARRPGATVALPAAAAWAIAEYGRDNILTGNPWGLLGYSQMPLPADAHGPGLWLASHVVQVADVGGVYAISFVLVVVNAGIAEAVMRIGRIGDALVSLRAAGATVTALLVGVATYGEMRLQDTDPSDAEQSPIAIVQANLDLGSQWDPTLYGLTLLEQLKMTAALLEKEPAALVVWPENAMTFFVDQEPAYRRTIAAALAPASTELLAGAPRHSDDEPPHYYNSAFLLDHQGEVLGSYDKQHLLPFAEYFPFGSNGLLRRNFGRMREFSPGQRPMPLRSGIGELGILICNEVMFPRLARERARDGAEILVNLSNDSWVGSAEFAEHQLAIASTRAIEQRRYLIRSSTWGPSAIIGPRGFVQARTATGTAATLRGVVSRQNGETFFGRFGSLFVGCCVAGLLVAAYRRRPTRAADTGTSS